MFFILLLQEEPVSIHGLTLAPASVAPPLEDRTGRSKKTLLRAVSRVHSPSKTSPIFHTRH
jgi:hypothetical protein